MRPQLIALGEGPDILLEKQIMLFGRHPECDVQLNSRKISRRHCCVAQIQTFLIARDLGSTNGIRLNGQRMNEARLNDGDELTIGDFRYRVDMRRPKPKSVGHQRHDTTIEKAENPIILPEDFSVQGILPAQPAPSKPGDIDRPGTG